jgi:MoaA/NifB/PqqE/SkfB family radical SAM enzyme
MSHPDFVEMVRLAKATGAKVEATTNGTLLTRSMAQALVDLEMDRLVVSIDGACPEIYGELRPPASLGQVVDNLRWLMRFRIRRGGRFGKPRVALAFVAMKRNAAELAMLPALASRVGAAEILVSNLVPHTAEMEQEILYEQALRACAFRASRWVPELSLPKLDVDGPILAPLQQVFASRASVSLLDASLSSRNDYCRFAQEGYAAIRWDGEVSPCLSLLHDHPEYIRGRRKDVTHFAVGNVNRQPLGDLWESEAFSQFRQRLRDFHFSPCTTCGGCERFPYNLEDCTANTFPTCGGCLWAQGFVQCA